MKIRTAKHEDLPTLVDLWWGMMSTHKGYDEKYYNLLPEEECRKLSLSHATASLEDENRIFLVAEDAGVPVGFILLEIQTRPPIYIVQHYAAVDSVVVAQEYRKKGVFKALLERALELLKERGIELIELRVDAENEEARTAYEQLGFSQRQEVLVRWI